MTRPCSLCALRRTVVATSVYRPQVVVPRPLPSTAMGAGGGGGGKICPARLPSVYTDPAIRAMSCSASRMAGRSSTVAFVFASCRMPCALPSPCLRPNTACRARAEPAAYCRPYGELNIRPRTGRRGDDSPIVRQHFGMPTLATNCGYVSTAGALLTLRPGPSESQPGKSDHTLSRDDFRQLACDKARTVCCHRDREGRRDKSDRWPLDARLAGLRSTYRHSRHRHCAMLRLVGHRS